LIHQHWVIALSEAARDMVFVLPFAWMTELKSTLLKIVDDDML
jgi:hypothetical protein